MIEQYTIPNKYNFPQPNIDTFFPQRFLEQSLYSLKRTQNQPLHLNDLTQQLNQRQQCFQTLHLKPEPIMLKPNNKETIIAATDTSTIKIGDTKTGIIVAMRGAITWRQNSSYNYTRLGPFILHITEENKNQLYNALEKAYFNISYEKAHPSAPNISQMPTRLASLLERWIQTMLAKTINDGVLLFDGSLMAGTLDTPVQRLKEILSLARRNKNTVLAFSKATTLRANGILITEQHLKQDPPYLVETSGLYSKPPQALLGDVYVARLNKSNLAFRLDIDREINSKERVEALQKLLGNDLHAQSYPETLRLAHILCTFTANEVIAIKHFITIKHGIQTINRPDMHKLLFGSFGSGEFYA